MPTRNDHIKLSRLAIRAAAGRMRAAATARARSHRPAANTDEPASRQRLAALTRGERRRRPQPQATDRCARTDETTLAEADLGTPAYPTLLVMGDLFAADMPVAPAAPPGLRISERAESVFQALRQPELFVDAFVAHVTWLHSDVAQLLVSLAHGRRVRAASVVYEYGSVRAVELLRVAGFDLFRAADGQVDRQFVLAKLKRAVAATFAPERTDSEPELPRMRHRDDTTPAARHRTSHARRRRERAGRPARQARARVRT
ncbi:MerR family transcriptional regulator [Burkholderia vietnamiensis]|uniref:MerR family transcriptional regulator n=1 Tax=Burkholderia vietnamiensis TaxID=60552 RepID=UPI001593B964|nr:MerR family transcriptional regulator [Burkholderia vietnamiensis]